MDIIKLYDFATKNKIFIFEYDIPKIKVLSIIDATSQNRYMGIDKTISKDEKQKKILIAIGLGFFETDSLYGENTNKKAVVTSRENALNWAIQQLVEKEEFENQIRLGKSKTSELAEYFEVPEEFMTAVFKFYKTLNTK